MTTSMVTPTSLLILGGPATGKSNYGAQLLGRLKQRKGQLRLRLLPEDMTLFEVVLERLNAGVAAEHTATTTYAEIQLPVQSLDNVPVDLVWPDYGGEQVRQITAQRRITSTWEHHVRASNGWVLFVRLQHTITPEDLLVRPLAALPAPVEDGPNREFVMPQWSEQAVLVELLQILLFTKGTGMLQRVARPPLTILLSCWDELPGLVNGVRPVHLLQERMPLFAHFVAATWQPQAWSVYGLSSLGRSLDTDQPDEEYINEGPEQFG